MCNTYYDCSITLQTALKIAVMNLYCKITLVWLDSSLSVPTPCTRDRSFKSQTVYICNKFGAMKRRKNRCNTTRNMMRGKSC